MGSNHARVLAGLPGISLAGVVDPLEAHRNRVTDFANCPTFDTLERLLGEGVDAVTIAAPNPSASRDRARLHRAQDPCDGGKADRIFGRRRTRHRRRRAARRRHPDGRSCRALQSGRRRHQAGADGRGHPVDRHHPRRPVPAAHVECRRRDRSRRARHRPDPLVHRIRHRRGAAAALQRGRRARGHRAACSSAPPRACSPISTPTG